MIDYNRNIELLLSNTFVKEDYHKCLYSVFRFQDLPVERIFSDHYQFFQEYLDNHLLDYQIQPTKLFYNSCDSINGWAAKENGIGIISINRGSLIQLEYLFDQDPVLFYAQPELKRIEKLSNICDSPIWRLMHQTSLLYLFYHEVGHIIQNSSKVSFDVIEETTDQDSSFDQKSHELEIDADMFAAIRLAKHGLQYWRKLQSKNKSKDNLLTIVSIILSGIVVYRLKLFQYSGPFYYRKNKHPHIVIRIAALITNIIDYLNTELNSTRELDDETLDPKSGYEVSMPIIKIISDKVLGAEAIGDYSSAFLSEAKGIKEYYGELLEGMKADPESAFNKSLKIPKK